MVTLRKRRIGNKEYFYLRHPIRTPDGIKTHEKYLGPSLPSNTEEAKREFLDEIHKERWLPLLYCGKGQKMSRNQ